MPSPHRKMGRMVAARAVRQDMREAAIIAVIRCETDDVYSNVKAHTRSCSGQKGRRGKEACRHAHRTKACGRCLAGGEPSP